jgi:hypothetical protein
VSTLSIDSSTPPRGTPAWWSLHWRRTAAGGAILVLLIGTHIPRLVIGPENDGPDKLLHLAAFATITMLLRVSSPSRPWWWTGLLALALAFVDEITQELPGLNRSFDPMDLVADAGGIAIALAWCGALGAPDLGPDWYQESHRRRVAGCRLLLASLMNWFHLGVAGVFGAMIGGVLLTLLVQHPAIGPITMVVIGAEAGLVAGVVAALEIGRRHSMTRLLEDLHCLNCLQPDVQPGSACDVCGEIAMPVDDLEIPTQGRRSWLIPLVASVLGSALVLIGANLWLETLRWRLVRPWPVLAWYDRLSVPDAMSLDAIILGLAGALSVWFTRRLRARSLARSGDRCLACGHDLRGTADEDGRGRCPECGLRFRRGIADGAPTGEHAVS